jgi:hypothetical protein
MSVWTQVFLWIATAAQTAILIWGLKKISSVLNTDVAPAPDGGAPTTFALSMLSEKSSVAPAAGGNGVAANGAAPVPTEASFSRVAGSIGAIVLAAFIGGVSYWILYGLFNGNDLAKLKEIGPFVLAGSALFAPYAFNQLSAIFR